MALLIRELAAAGWRQTLVCRTGAPLGERLAGTPGLGLRPAATRWSAWWSLPAPGKGGAIFHAHTGNTIPLAVAAAWRHRRAGGRSVITRRLDLKPKPWLFRRADAVVAISHAVAAVARDAGVVPERLHVIPSAIDRSRRLDADDRERLRRGLGLGEGAVLGLTIAAMVEQKDPLTLVRALPELPPAYHHLWIGGGDLAAAAAAEADRLGVSDRFHAPGFDPAPDRWFAAADLFVLPSAHEGLGSVLLDAFHFRQPVVASAIPGTADLIRPDETALTFPPGDAGALAARVRELLANPAAAGARVAAAAALVAGYDIADTARSYAALYRRLAGLTAFAES